MLNKNVVHPKQEESRKVNLRFVILLVTSLIVLFGALFFRSAPAQQADSIQSGSGDVIVTYSDALSMQYAGPWLELSEEGLLIVEYSDALSMQYAQPWLDSIQDSTSLVGELGNGLPMQYAQPWLDAQNSNSCNGRLDVMYACENRTK